MNSNQALSILNQELAALALNAADRCHLETALADLIIAMQQETRASVAAASNPPSPEPPEKQ